MKSINAAWLTRGRVVTSSGMAHCSGQLALPGYTGIRRRCVLPTGQWEATGAGVR
jgi:hypothetical protein